VFRIMKASHHRSAVALAGLVVLFAALAGCSSSNNSSPAAAKTSGTVVSADGFKINLSDCSNPAAATKKVTGTYTIGYSAALSGPIAGAAALDLDGYKARIAAQNAAGGIHGIKIKVIYQDDEFTPVKAKANVLQFVQSDHVNAVDTIGDGQVGAMAGEADFSCTPMLYPGSDIQTYRNISQYPWIVEFLPAGDAEAHYDIGLIKSKFPGGATVGIAENTSAAGVGEAQALEAAAKGTNITIKLVTPDTDPNAAATALAAAKVDVVYVAGVTVDCGPDATAMASIGFTPKLIVNPNNCDDATNYIAAGSAANGIVLPEYIKNPADPRLASDPDVTEYLSQVHTSDKDNAITVEGWLSAQLTINTLEQAYASPAGLSAVGVIEAARDQDYAAPMMLPGIKWVSTATDLIGFNSFQTEEWNASTKTFDPEGGLISVSGG
jgi:branched-chain amino acid transport system substrate-binding protein